MQIPIIKSSGLFKSRTAGQKCPPTSVTNWPKEVPRCNLETAGVKYGKLRKAKNRAMLEGAADIPSQPMSPEGKGSADEGTRRRTLSQPTSPLIPQKANASGDSSGKQKPTLRETRRGKESILENPNNHFIISFSDRTS
ncbi:MAG: hypothetical protein NTX03_06370, partial [Bacteroidetes bacterium]|nr:hypothetical protein [Bacteroidota bacterium]